MSTLKKAKFILSNYAQLLRQFRAYHKHTVIQDASKVPASISQNRFYYLHSKSQNSAYVIKCAYRFEGVLDTIAFENALNKIIYENEIFRTTFHVEENQLMQKIAPGWCFKLEHKDLTHMQNLAEVDKYINQLCLKPFRLNELPLFKVYKCQLNKNEFKLVFCIHHIIADGWTIYSLFRKINQYYSQASSHVFELNIIDPNIQYKSYASIEKHYLCDISDKDLRFWYESLHQAKSIALPFQKKSFNHHPAAHNINQMIPKDLYGELLELRKKVGVSLNMVMMSCFYLLLHLYTRQDNITVVMPRFSRFHPTAQKIMGPMLYPLPFVKMIKSDTSCLSFIKEVHYMVQKTLKHDNNPFDVVINKLHSEGNLSLDENLFNVLYNFISEHWRINFDMKDLNYKKEEFVAGESDTLITFYVIGDKVTHNLNVQITFLTEYIEPEMARVFLNHYIDLLRQITKNPRTQIDSLILKDNTQFIRSHRPQKLLENQSFLPVLTPIVNNMEKLKKSTAIQKSNDDEISYAQLQELTLKIFTILNNMNINKGDIVCLTGVRDERFYAALLAILGSNHTLYLLDTEQDSSYLAYVRKAIDIKAVILCGDEAEFSCICNDLKDISDLIQLNQHTLQKTHQARLLDFKKSINHIQAMDRAYVVCTSGSTGSPKVICGSHGGLSHFISWQAEYFNINESDTCAQLTNVAFDVCYREILTPLYAGSCLSIAPYAIWSKGEEFFFWLEEKGITFFHIVPSILQHVLDASKHMPCEILSTLRWVFFAGEPLTESIINRLRLLFYHNAQYVNLYGPSETVLAKMFYIVPDNIEYQVQPIGQPIPNTIVEIKQNNRDCSIGELGEIYITAPHTHDGYLNLSKEINKTKFKRSENGVTYATGDVGFRDAQGIIHIRGRIDEQVKINGVRIDPNEISRLAKNTNEVLQAVTILEPKTKTLILYLEVSTPHSPLSLEAKVKSQMPKYLQMSLIHILDSMPRLPSGKIDKQKLITMAPSVIKMHKQTKPAIMSKPSNAMEQWLYENVLPFSNYEEISCDQSFASLNLSSLELIQLIIKIQNKIDVRIKLRDVYAHNTIRELAAYLEQVPEMQNEQEKLQGLSIRKLKEKIYLVHHSIAIHKTQECASILLTGVTGFLGKYILKELIRKYPTTQIYCIIRDTEYQSASERLAQICKSLAIDMGSGNIHAVSGDLAKDNFGLSSKLYHSLANAIDLIIHSGAYVNFLLDYDSLSKVNVEGTKSIIDFCCHGKTKRLEYISTAGIFPANEFSHHHPYYEQDSIYFNDDTILYGGYAQTKWVSEALVQEARKVGLTANIYRLGRISGDSIAGNWPEHDFVNAFLKTIRQSKLIPDLPISIDLLPVDVAAKMIVLGTQAQVCANAYHLINPNIIFFKDLASYFLKLNHPVSLTTYAEWRQAIIDSVCKNTPYSLAPFLPILPKDHTTLPRLNYARQFDCANTLSLIANTDVTFPPLDERLLRLYLKTPKQE